MLAYGTPPENALATLCNTVMTIVASGYQPGNKEQGYVLRKLLRLIHRMGGRLDHPFFEAEIGRQALLRANYLRLRGRYAGMSPRWWFETHGIELADMEESIEG
jgi:hypothetical protein